MQMYTYYIRFVLVCLNLIEHTVRNFKTETILDFKYFSSIKKKKKKVANL